MRISSAAFGLALLAAIPAAFAQPPSAPPGAPPANRPPPLTITNPPFEDGGVIPDQYTAKAATQPAGSFALSWTNVPAGTQSFVVLMHDLDVAIGRSMTDNLHWLAFNIPGTATSLPANLPMLAQLPDGTVQLRRGNAPNFSYGYAGPGAPPGNYHHYSVELFALDTKLTLDSTATRDAVAQAASGHVLGKAVLVGRFHR